MVSSVIAIEPLRHWSLRSPDQEPPDFSLAKLQNNHDMSRDWIRFRKGRLGQNIGVTVANSTRGFPSRQHNHAFERIYCADLSQGRKTEGVVLGLSPSREIARAHGGDLTIKVNAAGDVQFSSLLSV